MAASSTKKGPGRVAKHSEPGRKFTPAVSGIHVSGPNAGSPYLSIAIHDAIAKEALAVPVSYNRKGMRRGMAEVLLQDMAHPRAPLNL